MKFEQIDGGLSAVYDGKAVVRIDGRFMCVGVGENSYSMSHGSFKIKEKIKTKRQLNIVSMTASEDCAIVRFDEGAIKIEVDGDRLKFIPQGLDKYNRMWIRIPATADERVYGSGEVFSEFNLRGKKANVWVAEHINALQIAKKLIKQVFGIKNTTKKQKFSNYETYYAQPTFISSKKYFYHSLTTARAEFDFENKEFHTIKTDEITPFYIGYDKDFEAILENLTELVGRQPILPEWVYDGQILGVQGGTETMLKKYDTAVKYGAKVNGIWIQDWEGRRVTAVGKQLYWNWQWDKELYPNLDKAIKELNEKGVKVLGYCNPFLAVEKPLYKEASEKGYCVKDKEGKDYYVTITTFPAAMVDLSNPAAYDWIKGIIKENMIGLGLSGWMADFGEYLPTDCVLYSGENPEVAHNTWPARWAKLNREAVEECGKLGEIMFFTRAGYSDTPKYSTMMWNGDNHVDFSIDFGLPSVIPAMLSLTCCGFGLSHSDIGGYTTFLNLKRSEELYMRWCEMNAFSPLMRGHEGLNPDLNAQFDASEQVLKHGAKFSKIHTALKPYIKSAVEYNAQKGVGVVRPLFFYYDEQGAYDEAYEYLLGRDILVAPVIKAGATKREVYLPNDKWIHLESGKEYGGGRFTVDAPVGKIPVFVRKNAEESVLNITKNLFAEA
ncbi:MAG: alpha-glucosidase [Clostridiales bacterium]|nr:alpha-glucosidase [Clostridiales bacterium]